MVFVILSRLEVNIQRVPKSDNFYRQVCLLVYPDDHHDKARHLIDNRAALDRIKRLRQFCLHLISNLVTHKFVKSLEQGKTEALVNL